MQVICTQNSQMIIFNFFFYVCYYCYYYYYHYIMYMFTSTHLQVVKCVLHYLKGSLFYGLSFQTSSSLDLITYTDVDWASCPDDRHSPSGYYIFFGGNLVSWSAFKQRWFLAAWPTQQLKSLGSSPYLKNYLFPCFNLLFFIVIISALLIWLQILSFILGLNIWKLIIILFMNESAENS